MKRRLSLFIVIGLIAVIVAASLAVLYEKGILAPRNSSQTNSASVLWQSNIENFATDIAFDNGRVFMVDNWGNVGCFDSQSGESVWNASLGGFVASGSQIEVYGSKLYVGSEGGIVNKLDENTGKLELTFQAPVSSSFGAKSSPDFFVADGKVFASRDGVAAYDATNGELFWKSDEPGAPWDYGLTRGNASSSFSKSTFVFIRGTNGIDPNNGSILWHVNGSASDPSVVTQGQVILWNYNPMGSPDNGQP